VAFKYWVSLDSENDDKIAWSLVWQTRLLTEPADSLSVSVWNTGRDRNAYRDRLLYRTFPATLLTSLWHATHALARLTRALKHSGHDTHMLHVIHHP
jgi:S-adenosylmethionine:diacylglycerol 3-amino-3-carboxypropyl transferase